MGGGSISEFLIDSVETYLLQVVLPPGHPVLIGLTFLEPSKIDLQSRSEQDRFVQAPDCPVDVFSEIDSEWYIVDI